MDVRSLALAAALLVASSPHALADAEDYRGLAQPPAPPNPTLAPLPIPAPLLPPCTVTTSGASVNVDCNPLVDWAAGPFSQWVGDREAEATAWGGEVQAWATVDFSAWAAGAPGQSGSLMVDEFAFSGPGTAASIHVHDDLPEPFHSQVTFAVKGGPGGTRWACQHACAVPDAGIFVSIDPLDLSPNEHLTLSPSLPAVTGTIDVTFS